MNRQQIFDNFVNIVNGKGQATDDAHKCLYFPDNHPGCAIGCQPGFREKFEGKITDITICELLEDSVEFGEFFEVDSERDVEFLSYMQDVHDDDMTWGEDGCINHDVVQEFCDYWNLQNPLNKAKKSN